MTRQLNAVATPACPYGSVQRDDAGEPLGDPPDIEQGVLTDRHYATLDP